MRYRFGEYELDDAAYTLTRAGTSIPLQPKMFELLRYLIEQRERVVTKDELLDTLWPGEHVNQSAVTWTVSHVRNALGQGRGHKRPIETIHGRGYRFTAPVEALATPQAPGAVRVQTAAPAPPPGITPRPFVGRAAVMRRLETLLRDAAAGHGHLCLLLGEAGIGRPAAPRS
jgi:DNA-binding winged helix-turn-helix (wHTH) protein